MNKFKKLMEPFNIKQVRTRNRIVKSAQRLGFVDKEGYITQQDLDFYERLARGGVGMIIIDHAFVDFPMGAKIHQASMAEDKYILKMAELSKIIHSHGCPTFLQLNHVGSDHDTSASGGKLPLTPSALSEEEMHKLFPFGKHSPTRALTISEIEDIIEKFGKAAVRAQKAGFDGIELHGAHSYLVASFLSPVWNRRDDKYGSQNLENRTRFAVEIIKAVRERVGKDFPVGFRINGGEYGMPDATTAVEGRGIARILEATNGVDYIHVSAFGFGNYNAPLYLPEQVFYPEPPKQFSNELRACSAGTLIPLAAGIKKVVSIPVIAVGRIDPLLGEWVLRKGMADLIAFGRRLLADPDLPRKISEGRYEDIAPCTACVTCSELSLKGEEITCRINPALGKERESEITVAEKKKRVLVIGGGPAGMEAARVAALRGHEVILYEKGPKLGGLLSLAAMIKGTEVEDIPAITKYLKIQIAKLGVKVNLRKEFKPELIGEIHPDVVLLASGGVPATLSISGIDRRNVVTTASLERQVKLFLNIFGPRFLAWITKFWLPIGKRVVIIGGQIYGCEAAEFLTKRGREVTIVEESQEWGTKMLDTHRNRLIPWLRQHGANLITGAKYEEIVKDGLVISIGGRKQTIKADTILVTITPQANTEFMDTLKKNVPEVYQIGDARQPGLILDAIHDGFCIARII
jgi:2,4-dienoyl-CoA reductase (NADPH2)